MNIDRIISDPAEIRRATRLLSSPGNLSENPEFNTLADAILQAAIRLEHVKPAIRRQLIPLAVRYIHRVWGLEAVLSFVKDKISAGVPARDLTLHALAACRREAQYDRALSYFENLTNVPAPDSYTLLLLGQSLAALGEFDQLAVQSRRARHILETTPWLVEQWSRLAVDNLVLGEARRWIQQIPLDSPVRNALVDRLESFESGEDEVSCPIRTEVISLHRDDRKWDIARRSLGLGGYSPHRFKATDGRDLPFYALRELGSDSDVTSIHGAGAIATALSHIRVLEDFLSKKDEHLLVLEDDAAPFMHWSAFQETLERLDADFVFLNERVSRQYGSPQLATQGFTSPWEILGIRDERLNGIGLDAYLVSRSGAEKVLDFVAIDKIRAHIDAQFVAYGIADNSSPAVSRGQSVISRLRAGLPSQSALTESLSCICLDRPMFWANNHGASDTNSVSMERRQ
ncbi:hypothetical protein [Corynebacterium sp. LK2510]|uniref:hypothetical protein n=1 Tax=Corynebacterium sp. LK2510 TaxID=3110472 RepID=UPI0034CF13D8